MLKRKTVAPFCRQIAVRDLPLASFVPDFQLPRALIPTDLRTAAASLGRTL